MTVCIPAETHCCLPDFHHSCSVLLCAPCPFVCFTSQHLPGPTPLALTLPSYLSVALSSHNGLEALPCLSLPLTHPTFQTSPQHPTHFHPPVHAVSRLLAAGGTPCPPPR